MEEDEVVDLIKGEEEEKEVDHQTMTPMLETGVNSREVEEKKTMANRINRRSHMCGDKNNFVELDESYRVEIKESITGEIVTCISGVLTVALWTLFIVIIIQQRRRG